MSVTKHIACDDLVDSLYGGLVPAPDAGAFRADLLHEASPPQWAGASLQTWRWQVTLAGGEARIACAVQVLRPVGPHPAPVLLWGDACWAYLDDEAKAQALARGVALAWFNRTELAHDAPDGRRAGPVFERYPQARFGAIAAWAWSLSRGADLLVQVPGLDARRIGLVGHSRGGKAALLAGACDERFALVAAHNSGAAGAGSSWLPGEGAESLEDLRQAFPHWLARDAQATLPALAARALDQDLLLSAIAPRRLLVLQARGDAWAHPAGTQAMVERAGHAWRERGMADRVRLVCREGGHPMGLDDWLQVFDAMHGLGS